jgi:hypothetical protein
MLLSGSGFGDDRLPVADDDLLAGDRLQLCGEVAGAAVRVDPRFVEAGPEVVEAGLRDRRQNTASSSHPQARRRAAVSITRFS